MTDLEIRISKRNRSFNLKVGELEPINYNKFVEAIEKHMPFFIWREDSFWGEIDKDYYQKQNRPIPDNYYKHQAYCYKVKNETYYRFSISFNTVYDIIFITNTAPAKMTIEFLEILLDVANHCDCKLYKTATKVITREFADAEKKAILENKALKASSSKT